MSIKGEKKKLPRRAGDGQGIQQVRNSSLKSKITSTLGTGDGSSASNEDEEEDDRQAPTRKTREHLQKFVKHINSDL
eukprot:CAMPEP_0197068486 /NCGR_PEP_ID=MMETSP1384-20130603/187026_1 /TAXON_ID=29189 /ORGANISM="Ammonia sp." /LENGTH=76 /DNA_ID=CAMNT_0042506239 /DNA_START=56 /DNA_END=283 /DNA_ORIENTATION=+